MASVIVEIRRRMEELEKGVLTSPPADMAQLQNRVGQYKALNELQQWMQEQAKRDSHDD